MDIFGTNGLRFELSAVIIFTPKAKAWKQFINEIPYIPLFSDILLKKNNDNTKSSLTKLTEANTAMLACTYKSSAHLIATILIS
ncbi:hypothetical protein Glove_344g40 [Diversispora epigaea]|uniref:Uncharacterized protein n=1 Tax=Diversispora epigaea TaxID=1348612 RepID=A0A397HLH5_9GLOM|nr:hypothetical protein Glove_344g40 [Diversispora epigaea]